jgi:hypothetical protein
VRHKLIQRPLRSFGRIVPSAGPLHRQQDAEMSQIVFQVAGQTDGYWFRLAPGVWDFLTAEVLEAAPSREMFFSLESTRGFHPLQHPFWSILARSMTGLSEAKLEALGGYRYVEAETGKLLYESGGREQDARAAGQAD